MLQPKQEERGLWSDPQWRIGKPATFAVIIGVSKYSHLVGGDAPIPDAKSYDLDQLYVSALTAYRFFQWLQDVYRYTAAPLARCWLLLSPTDAEKTAEPDLMKHSLEANLDNCDHALNDWAKVMRDHGGRGSDASSKSRAIFFFSGHGLEQHEEAQILCPADFLKNGSPQRAISTANLNEALRTIPIRDQIVLFDACRNNAEKLQSMIGMKGWDLVSVDSKYTNRNRNYIRATATGSGERAWQPRSPNQGGGVSIFGQALLEGLEARALTPPARSLTPDCEDSPCCVRVAPLETFLRTRIPRLLKEAADRYGGSVESQPVRFLRESEEIALTEVPTPSGRLRDTTPGLAPAGPPPGPLITEVFTEKVELGTGWTPRGASFNDAHPIFGREAMTRVWIGERVPAPRVFSISTGQWLGEPDPFQIFRVERDAAGTKYRIVLQLASRESCWFELADETGRVFAVVLPGDRVRPKFALDIDLDPGQQTRIVSMHAGIATDSGGPLAIAQQMWDRYRNVSAVEAANAIDMLTLERVLGAKVESPLAATVAAVVLLRGGRLELLHDWLENLANLFPDRPDAAVLRAEQLRRQSVADASTLGATSTVGRNWTLSLLERGLPQLSETVAMAASQVDLLLRDDQQATSGSTAPRHDDLVHLDAQLDNAVKHFRSGGLFATFSGQPHSATPNLIAPALAPATH